jgi:superfamily I DNA/RNA helicase
LVGDGAQTIYRRGFSLRTAGIEVANRSYVMKKNYRNTQEVLRASFGLIEHYEVADVDEDNIARPTEPDFPTRHGEKPIIVKCRSLSEQIDFVASRIDEILETSLMRDVYEGLEPTRVPICVIGMNQPTRERVALALEQRRIMAAELREDSSLSGPTVKISTIESAKGHEFHTVFLVDLVEGTMPRFGTTDEDVPREAARLYVGMTRACERLYLTYTSSEKCRPSRFLFGLQSHCTEMEYANKGLTLID